MDIDRPEAALVLRDPDGLTVATDGLAELQLTVAPGITLPRASLTTALAPNLTVMIIGWSFLEGVGAALILLLWAALAAVLIAVSAAGVIAGRR